MNKDNDAELNHRFQGVQDPHEVHQPDEKAVAWAREEFLARFAEGYEKVPSKKEWQKISAINHIRWKLLAAAMIPILCFGLLYLYSNTNSNEPLWEIANGVNFIPVSAGPSKIIVVVQNQQSDGSKDPLLKKHLHVGPDIPQDRLLLVEKGAFSLGDGSIMTVETPAAFRFLPGKLKEPLQLRLYEGRLHFQVPSGGRRVTLDYGNGKVREQTAEFSVQISSPDVSTQLDNSLEKGAWAMNRLQKMNQGWRGLLAGVTLITGQLILQSHAEEKTVLKAGDMKNFDLSVKVTERTNGNFICLIEVEDLSSKAKVYSGQVEVTPDKEGKVSTLNDKKSGVVGKIFASRINGTISYSLDVFREGTKVASGQTTIALNPFHGIPNHLKLVRQKVQLVDRFGMIHVAPKPPIKNPKGKFDGSAVDAALNFLVLQQKDGGHWMGSGDGKNQAETAATGLSLLALLGAGHTEKVGKHKATVMGGVQWLLKHQNENGHIRREKDNWGGDLLTHTIAGIALAEAGGMGRYQETIRAAQKALNWTIKQNSAKGNKDAKDELKGWPIQTGGKPH